MAKEVLGEIITRIQKSKYFSVFVDSTPDEAHIDQLTIVVRYIYGKNESSRKIFNICTKLWPHWH